MELNVNVNDLYWLSGIIEGEGSLTTNTRNGVHKKSNSGNGSSSYITRISMANTDMHMLKRISEILCAMGVKFWYRLDTSDKRFPNAMGYIHISIEGYRSCKKVLDSIVDKLTDNGSKKKQAELMIDYINYRLGFFQQRSANGSYSNNNLIGERDRNFAIELKRLKKVQIFPSTTKRRASTPLEW